MSIRVIVLAVLIALSSAVLALQTGSDDTENGAEDFDLDSLVDRIAHSKALGFLTKLSLKKDIDGFLADLRRYHAGGEESTLDELHERYDVMVHKHVVMLQDKDTELVKSIDVGRDKLWAMLADQKKFASL